MQKPVRKPDLAGATTSPDLIARRAVWAACFGFFVDMFDVYLPIAVLGPALAYFIPAGLSGAAQATIFYVVFAVTLIGRPLGAAIFGHFGDRMGRRQTTLISVAGFGIVTLVIAALPGYAAWGNAAIAILVVLRLLDGIFIGGEYTAANPLAMEYSPKEKRGLYAAFIHIGYPAALVCVSLLATVMLKFAPSGGPGSAYAVWGWRIPFVIGALLSGLLFFCYYHLVPESELWRSAKKSAAPLKELFSGPDLRRVGQLFVVMTGAWLTLNATVGAFPGVINTVLGVESSGVNTGTLIGAAISAAIYPLLGLLSQKFGRRTTIAMIGLVNLAPACTLYYILVAGAYRDPISLVALVASIVVLSLPVWAVHTPYLAESFRTEIRSSGYGISYSLATILPGLYSFYMLGLAKLMPYQFGPIVLLALGGALLSIGALAGPETKDVDLRPEEPGYRLTGLRS
jgi:MFS family permease